MAKSSAAPRAEQNDQGGQSSGAGSAGNKPVETLRYRNLKAAIWKNQGQSQPFYSVTFTRSYRDQQEQWHDVTSFNSGDLPMLAKLANDCHSFITRQERKSPVGGSSQGGSR